MSSQSPKLGLTLPDQPDPFSTLDIKTNWQKVDASPGSFICTSTTRPAWNEAQAGRKILETNTGLEWWWTGTEFRRLAPLGLLKRNDGTWAVGERPTDFETTSNSYVRVVSVTNVVVPAGTRPLKIEVSWRQATNSAGNFTGALFRSDTNNSGPAMGVWVFATSSGSAGGGVFTALERDGLAAGTYNFSFQIDATNGTSKIVAGPTSPVRISVIEL